jgi:hypothetical protein
MKLGKQNGRYIHGMCGTRFYNIYVGIVTRCHGTHSPQCKKDYLERGVKMLWNNFVDFRDDMYESYLAHIKEYGEKNTSIDRVDNDGNYCKENCRWATRAEQNINTRKTRLITMNGVTKSFTAWCKEYNICYTTVMLRWSRGWNNERAFTETVKRRKSKRIDIVKDNK